MNTKTFNTMKEEMLAQVEGGKNNWQYNVLEGVDKRLVKRLVAEHALKILQTHKGLVSGKDVPFQQGDMKRGEHRIDADPKKKDHGDSQESICPVSLTPLQR